MRQMCSLFTHSQCWTLTGLSLILTKLPPDKPSCVLRYTITEFTVCFSALALGTQQAMCFSQDHNSNTRLVLSELDEGVTEQQPPVQIVMSA